MLVGGKPLCIRFPTLFELNDCKYISVADFVRRNGLTPFRRWLPTILQTQWELLKQQALNFPLIPSKDTVSWQWSSRGVFTIKSVYDRLTSDDKGETYSRIWKAGLPYKIKIFLWLLEQDAILNKENMVRRNWVADPSCRFCNEFETLNHLFFSCPTTKVAWSIVARCIGADNIPNFLSQFWRWFRSGFLLNLNYMPSYWQLCVGQSGKHEMMLALMQR